MGAQISRFYTDIEPKCNIDFWKLSTGINKTTNEKHMIWIMDVPALKEHFPKKSDRDAYLDKILSSIQQMRKFRHPHILKIIEFIDKKPEIGFTSELFDSIISSQIGSMHPMDVAYIGFQLAEVFSFLNEDARVIHLGLSPDAILIDENLTVKLTHFQFASTYDVSGTIHQNSLLNQSNYNYQYLPPEIISSRMPSVTSDVFLFGSFLYEAFTGRPLFKSNSSNENISMLREKQFLNDSKIPNEFIKIINNCLTLDPSDRPHFSDLPKDPAFQSMQLKALRYIDLILTKAPQDKFSFYKGLGTRIDDFSPTLQRIKILPTLLIECKNDVRFAPILLGPIFQISSKFSNDDFFNDVFKKISSLSTVLNPPEVIIALLRNLWLIVDKVDTRYHRDYVYPIFFNALQSNNPKIHQECLDKAHILIKVMNEETQQTIMIPRLLDVCNQSPQNHVVALALSVLFQCLSKIDNESFISENSALLTNIWKKHQCPEVAHSFSLLANSLKCSSEIKLSKLVPLFADVVTFHPLQVADKNQLCQFIIQSTQDFMNLKERSFNDLNNASQKSVSHDSDNPFDIPPENPTIISRSNDSGSQNINSLFDFKPTSSNSQNDFTSFETRLDSSSVPKSSSSIEFKSNLSKPAENIDLFNFNDNKTQQSSTNDKNLFDFNDNKSQQSSTNDKNLFDFNDNKSQQSSTNDKNLFDFNKADQNTQMKSTKSTDMFDFNASKTTNSKSTDIFNFNDMNQSRTNSNFSIDSNSRSGSTDVFKYNDFQAPNSNEGSSSFGVKSQNTNPFNIGETQNSNRNLNSDSFSLNEVSQTNFSTPPGNSKPNYNVSFNNDRFESTQSQNSSFIQGTGGFSFDFENAQGFLNEAQTGENSNGFTFTVNENTGFQSNNSGFYNQSSNSMLNQSNSHSTNGSDFISFL